MELFPWFLWGQRSQMMNGPCYRECKNFNPFSGRSDYLLKTNQQKCNDCIVKYDKYPWHAFTRIRIEDVFLWKILQDKIDIAQEVRSQALRRGYTSYKMGKDSLQP